jgi:lipoprotein-releasing system ATP-binding protein
VLVVSNVTKEYPTPRGALTILRDVSFAMNPGDAAAIMGPSGSGKSTLLYIVGGLEPPTSGEVTIDGKLASAARATPDARFRNSHIGFVFQDHCLLPQLSVLENVLLPTFVARNGRAGTPAQAVELGRSLVDQVGLGDRIDHRPAELSGGERQRVAIARALIRQPKVLLCDEPTGNLDEGSAAAVAALLLDLQRHHQAVLIVVTHSAALASKLPARFDLVHGALVRRGDQMAADER